MNIYAKVIGVKPHNGLTFYKVKDIFDNKIVVSSESDTLKKGLSYHMKVEPVTKPFKGYKLLGFKNPTKIDAFELGLSHGNALNVTKALFNEKYFQPWAYNTERDMVNKTLFKTYHAREHLYSVHNNGSPDKGIAAKFGDAMKRYAELYYTTGCSEDLEEDDEALKVTFDEKLQTTIEQAIESVAYSLSEEENLKTINMQETM